VRHTEIFKKYYQEQFWGNSTGCSGPNSDLKLTELLRKNIQKLLDDYTINSMLDAGCGDANLFRGIDISWLEYLGCDCVLEMIASNKTAFAQRNNMQFFVADVVVDKLPQADLILCRDVVHYLPNDLVTKMLNNFKQSNSKYLLITHNLYSNLSANSPTEIGVFRPVNLTLPPFEWPKPQEIIAEDVYGKSMAMYSL